MDRATLLAIVILWATCACRLSQADPACPPRSCTSNGNCNNRQICCGNFCKRCICDQPHQCMCNTTSLSAYCDCTVPPLTNKDGEYCECDGFRSGSECGCSDTFGFLFTCASYSPIFTMFNNRRLDFQGNTGVNEQVFDVSNNGVDTLDKCKTKCLLPSVDCNVLEWRVNDGEGNGNVKCRLYRMVNFIESAGKVNDNPNWQLHLRECQDDCPLR